MPDFPLLITALAAALALASLGGGLYEFLVVGAMRLWSAFDFIPKALAFERADKVDEARARAWTRRSRLRLPLDLVTCGAMLAAFAAVT